MSHCKRKPEGVGFFFAFVGIISHIHTRELEENVSERGCYFQKLLAGDDTNHLPVTIKAGRSDFCQREVAQNFGISV